MVGMGILETIKDKVMGGGREGQAMKMITQLISDSGGISNLVQKFNANDGFETLI